jgi:hypothetical protein
MPLAQAVTTAHTGAGEVKPYRADDIVQAGLFGGIVLKWWRS